MTENEAKTEIQKVLVAYPSYREWLRSTDTPNETFAAWCGMLAGCDAEDVSAVVSAIVSGDKPPVEKYDKPDALARRIREAANAIRSRRNERKRTDNLLHAACDEARAADPRLGYYWRSALWLGNQVRDKRITKAENDYAMQTLSGWYRNGGEKPTVIEEIQETIQA